MKRLVALMFAGALTIGALAIGPQTAAVAEPAAPVAYEAAAEPDDVSVMGWPTGCGNGKYDNGWSAECSKSNGGSYSASAICRPYDGGPLVFRDAAWRTSGVSYVFCPPLTQIQSGGINLKSTS
jgi:hypothetical protein